MVYKFFDKKSRGSGVANKTNYQLASEFHWQVSREEKFIHHLETIFGVLI